MNSSEQNKKKTNEAGKRRWKIVNTIIVVLLIAGVAYFGKSFLNGEGSGKQTAQTPQQPNAPVVVLYTVRKADLAIGKEYIGRVDPIQTVSLTPQVSGQIEKVYFKEGSMVKAGDLLFSIDDSQYRATVALRKAELSKAKANYDRAVKYDKRLKAADKRSVSASEIEMSESNVLQGKAAVDQAEASLRLAEIDLAHTQITAPVSGQIGEALLTKGNYVTPASGSLASIVQIDPIRVTFSLPDKDYLEQLAVFRVPGAPVYNASVRLAHGTPYPLKGTRDFENNVMDPKTATITVSLRFDNPNGFLVPGSMVRVNVKPVKSHIAAVIPQEAVMADTDGNYVYTVDDKNVASQRKIKLGDAIGSTMYEVRSGLDAGDRIVRKGIQMVRAGSKVQPVTASDDNAAKTPAELAKESGYDLKFIPLDDNGASGQDSAGGNN
jgi:RND family efflux transporter MFP subunit